MIILNKDLFYMHLNAVVATVGKLTIVPNKLIIARARMRMLKLCKNFFLCFMNTQINAVFVITERIISIIQ